MAAINNIPTEVSVGDSSAIRNCDEGLRSRTDTGLLQNNTRLWTVERLDEDACDFVPDPKPSFCEIFSSILTEGFQDEPGNPKRD